MRLIQAIDTGEASAADLERIILGDPTVAAMFLRITTKNGVGMDAGHGTVRNAVMQLGQKSVRTLAMSLALKHVVAAETPAASDFDKDLFSKHSLAVGFLARYLFAR